MYIQLIKNWKYVVIAALCVVIAGMSVYISSLKDKNAELYADVIRTQEKLAMSQANLLQLSNDIAVQNKAVEDLKKVADAKVAENAKLIAESKKKATKFTQTASNIMQQVPKENTTKCISAEMLINEAIRAKQ